MPRHFELMCPPSRGHVSHKPELSPTVENPATVSDGFGQSRITVMACGEEREVFSYAPALHPDHRRIGPSKRPNAVGLVPTVHAQGVVSSGSTVGSPFPAFSRIFKC